MNLDRKQCVELYENAACTGETALFSSSDRTAFFVARQRCAECPVVALCYTHVSPVEDGFTGTCAGRLYYDGTDVTDIPDALPPPVFRSSKLDVLILGELMENPLTAEWGGHTDSTVMAAFWGLRRQKFTMNKLAKLSGVPRLSVEKFILCFDDSATQDLKDFLA
jgi:hypothetical protein